MNFLFLGSLTVNLNHVAYITSDPGCYTLVMANPSHVSLRLTGSREPEAFACLRDFLNSLSCRGDKDT